MKGLRCKAWPFWALGSLGVLHFGLRLWFLGVWGFGGVGLMGLRVLGV